MQQPSQLERLIAAFHAAKARPNPPVSILGLRDETSRSMVVCGATHRKNRFGVGGAFVGYTYLSADGKVICESMTACGNPR